MTRNGDEDRRGLYANYFEVGLTMAEIILDFGQSYDGHEPTYRSIHTRIIMGPVYAKELHQTLGSTLEQFERKFGGENGLSSIANGKS